MHRVGSGNNYALVSLQSAGLADLEKTLDFLVHPTNRLHLAQLIH